MIHLFIDTNTFLSFYHFSDEDLGRLGDLQAFIKQTQEIKLYVSSQVVDEFKRNREGKIRDCLKQFSGLETKKSIPVICAGYDETTRMRVLIDELQQLKKALLEKLSHDIEGQTLKADEIIKAIFARAITVEDETVQAARSRFDLGRPPGKDNSYGDAINWEFLLKNVPDGEDLHFVSGDRDYSSPLEDTRFSQYLSEEWMEKKRSKIRYYKSLRSFFKEKYPKVEILRDEYIKDSKIRRLTESCSFNESRAILKELAKIEDFSDEQLNRIIKASVSNSQIYNAHTYSPELVGLPLYGIIENRHAAIDPELLHHFHSMFEFPDEPEDFSHYG